jgi:arylsulfatase A-like enzyme
MLQLGRPKPWPGLWNRAVRATQGLRVVYLLGRVAENRVSDGIMHVVDWFTTIAHAAGLSEPADRVIDGINQLDWLAGSQDSSLEFVPAAGAQ